MKKFTPNSGTVAVAVDRYNSGSTLGEVADFLGCSRPTARNILSDAGANIISVRRQRTQTPVSVEDDIVDMYESGAPVNEIVTSSGVTMKTVYNVLNRRNVDVTRKPGWTPDLRRTVVRMHSELHSNSEISDLTGISEFAVKKFTASGRTSVFTSVDTEEKAYWLGFITADGCVSGVSAGNLSFAVGLARKDRQHLVKLREFIGAHRDVLDYEAESIDGVVRPYSRFTSQDRALIMDLVRHGVTPRKTGRETPWNGPDHLMRHYWRGVVDGDGSVYSENAASAAVALVGSHDLVSGFLAWANPIAGTAVNPSADKRSPDHWRCVIHGKRQTDSLVTALYENASVALDRKMARAQELMDRATG